MVERCQSDIHPKMRKGTVKFQSQSFFSFEPIFEALIALEVPQRAYRPPLCTCTTPGHFSSEREHKSCTATGLVSSIALIFCFRKHADRADRVGVSCESAFDLGGFWPQIDAVFFASVWILTPEARIHGRRKRKIDSLAKDRGLSRSRFNRHSPGFNRHSPCFVCSVLRIAAGMAFSLAKDLGLSRCGMKCPAH